MRSPAPLPPPARRRIGLIAIAVALMTGGVTLVEWQRSGGSGEGSGPAILRTGEPIPAEADVFRLQPHDLGVDPHEAARSGARPRTLAGFRALRAYPGAPPRVPHELSAAEFRGTTCNTCHERGGWSARFGAYTPVTPHPEFRNCLQCHAADDGAVGIAATGGATAALAADARGRRPEAPLLVAVDWRTTAWPATGQQAMAGSPPAIPHGLELRGNCLACHAGASAVAEIRTTHPERANCRQCHASVYDVPDETFTRPGRSAASGTGGAP
jgi:nitrate reductase (cytochrome), electron transfer subunit